jgi:uncharacterized iron-regulated membrane protein
MAEKKKRGLRWALHQKRWFGKWHLYLGIIAGAILCVVGLTGSILVFQDEIDAVLNKSLFESLKGQKRYSIGEIVPVVQQKYPEKKFDYVFQTDEKNPNATYRFYNLQTEKEFFINPYTAEVCGQRLIESSFIRIVLNIHRSLLIPAVGRYIVGLATLCMLILTISGLRLWVPQQYKKWKQWRSVLTVNLKAGLKRQNYDWHNVLGFYSAPVVIMLSLTGFAITFSTVFIAFLFILTGQSPQSVAEIFDQKSAYTQGAKSLSTIDMAKIAAAKMPDAQLLGIAVPTNRDMVYRLDLKSAGPSETGNRIMLMVDQYTGKIVLNSETDFPNIGNSYLSWLTPIHYGTFGGMPTRILALLGGLTPLLLYITGFIIWWPRYKRQAGKATYVAPKPTLKERELDGIRNGALSNYFGYYFKRSCRYALLLLAYSFAAGALYGLISGVVVQPGLFAVLYTGIAIIVNFIVALLVFIFNLLFLAPFKRSKRSVFKYFSVSLAFAVIFLPVIIAIAVLSTNVF